MGVKKYTTRGKNYWLVDFRVRLPDGQTRRVIKRRIPTKELAVALEAQLKTEMFTGTFFQHRQQAKVTVRELWELYEPVTTRDNDSWQSDTGRAKHLLRHLGQMKAHTLTLKHVEEYRFKRANEFTKTTGQPPTVATVNREITLLKRIINHAVKCGEVRLNPIAHVKLLNEANVRQTVIGEERFGQLLEKAESALKPILLMAFDSGMRKSEILNLRWDQLDLKDGVIRLAPEDTKTDKARLVYLSRRTIAVLKEIPVPISGKGFVLQNPDTKKPWVDIRKVFRRACKAAAIPQGRDDGIIFHDLRRSFVTNARKRGIPESVVMKMSGHRTRSVFDRYNVVDDADLKLAVRQLEVARGQELGNEETKKTNREE